MPYREQATYYRATLLLGLVPCEMVVAWAEETIAREPEVPHELFEAVLVPRGDLTALRFALQPLADEKESEAISHAIFALARRDLESGKRNLKDTVMVFSQIRRNIAVAAAVLDELDKFEDDFMLANAGVTGEVAIVDRQVREWLAQFEGAKAI
jgi:hypothetical protein